MGKRPYRSYIKTEEENKLNKLVGEKLIIARKIAKLTQVKLAKKLNVSFQQIGKYEKGQNGLRAIRLVQMSEHLNIPYTDLLPELVSQVKPLADSSDVQIAIAPSLVNEELN